MRGLIRPKLEVVGLIRVRIPSVVRLIQVRVGSIGRANGSSGAFSFAWVNSCGPSDRRVRSGLRGFTQSRLRVVGFFRVCLGLLRRALGSSGAFGFTFVHSGAGP